MGWGDWNGHRAVRKPRDGDWADRKGRARPFRRRRRLFRRLPPPVQHRRHQAHRLQRDEWLAPRLRRRSRAFPVHLHPWRRPLRGVRLRQRPARDPHRLRRPDHRLADVLADSNRPRRPHVSQPGRLRGGARPGASHGRGFPARLPRGPAAELPRPRAHQTAQRREAVVDPPARFHRGRRGRGFGRVLHRGLGGGDPPRRARRLHDHRLRLQSGRRSALPAGDLRGSRMGQTA